MTRTRALLSVAAVALITAAGGALWWLTSGPDASQFAHLRAPRLIRLSDQRMLVVEASGDPNVVGASAFKLLFSTYYKLDGVSKMGGLPAPRARWRQPLDTSKDTWVGQYALPVPDSAVALPPGAERPLRTTIATWTYGDVGEILHVGSYSTEAPDITRLQAFIASRGYRVVGDHEEEYVRGPGMFFAGNPDKYLTIVRLRVEALTESR